MFIVIIVVVIILLFFTSYVGGGAVNGKFIKDGYQRLILNDVSYYKSNTGGLWRAGIEAEDGIFSKGNYYTVTTLVAFEKQQEFDDLFNGDKIPFIEESKFVRDYEVQHKIEQIYNGAECTNVPEYIKTMAETTRCPFDGKGSIIEQIRLCSNLLKENTSAGNFVDTPIYHLRNDFSLGHIEGDVFSVILTDKESGDQYLLYYLVYINSKKPDSRMYQPLLMRKYEEGRDYLTSILTYKDWINVGIYTCKTVDYSKQTMFIPSHEIDLRTMSDKFSFIGDYYNNVYPFEDKAQPSAFNLELPKTYEDAVEIKKEAPSEIKVMAMPPPKKGKKLNK